MTEPTHLAVAIALLAVSVMPAVAADPATTRSTRSASDESALEWSEFAPSERTRAGHWNLSATHWRRYRSLMDGIRGTFCQVVDQTAKDTQSRFAVFIQWAHVTCDQV